MTDLRTAAQQALQVLEALQGGCTDSNDGTVEAITVWCPEVIEALKAALEQHEQEPVAWQWLNTAHFRKKLPADAELRAWNPLYTHPPRREWRGLTEEEIRQIALDTPIDGTNFARAIEAALKERNA